MGSLTICCPAGTYLESAVTTLNPCPADVGQIQRLIFWRTGQSVASITTALIPTTWVTLAAATDATKALFTPFLHNPDMPAGDPREFGGGNETRWGAPLRKGGQSPVFTFSMLAEDQDVITALKQLRCETVDVLFVNEASQLVYSDAGGVIAGFPVVQNSLFIGDKKVGGFDEWDSNILQFNLQPNWSDSLEISLAISNLLTLTNS